MRACWYGWLLFLTATGCHTRSEHAREFNGDSALAYVKAQIAFGPRVPDTEGHVKAGDWIIAQLKSRADSVEIQAFTHVAVGGETLRLRNIIGKFRPDQPDRILLLAHWDSRPRSEHSANIGDQMRPLPGANDGASGVAVLLGVADALKRQPPNLGVDLLFVDGEDYGDFTADKDVLLGSRYYATHLPAGPRPLFAVLFDMVGDADLNVFQESNSVANAPEVVERVWNRADELGFGKAFRPSVVYGLTDDHIPLQKAGIRAIDVIDFEYGPNNSYWHTVDDTIDKVSARSLGIVGEVAVSLTR